MMDLVCCDFCKHSRHGKIDDWIPTCDAYPEGQPLDLDYRKAKETKECNHGIGYEPNEEAARWGMD